MGKPYSHQYFGEGSGCSHGTMVCAKCSRKIVPGASYRVYQQSCKDDYGQPDWMYVAHHRECCADDPQWAKRDAAEVKYKSDQGVRITAFKEFAAKWGITELDDLIEELEHEKRRTS